jgi:glycine cleavage system H lipoate-binding protein
VTDELKTATAIATIPASDADALTPEAKDAILRESAKRIRELVRLTSGNVIEIGQRLINCKKLLEEEKRGAWTAWLKVEFAWTDRTARSYMEFARKLAAETVSALPVSALHELIKIPQAARAEVIKQLIALVNAGERLTKTKISAAVQQLKSEQAEAAPPLAEPESNTPPPAPRDDPESAAEPKAKSPGEPRPPKSQASSLEPKPPVSRMINSLEIDRLISPKLKRIKDSAKRVDHSQISTDIILLADKIQEQIAKWTTEEPAARPDSEALAAE